MARPLIHELVLMPDDAALSCRAFAHTHFPFRWHRHRAAELTLIVRGDGDLHLGDACERIADGDLYLIAPDVPHAFSSQPRDGHQVRTVVAWFHPERLRGTGLREFARLPDLMQAAARGLGIQGALRSRLGAEVLEMAEETNPLARLSRLLAVLGALGDGGGDGCRPMASVGWRPDDAGFRPGLLRIIDFIHDHRAEDLSAAEVAEFAGVPPASFSRWFRRQFGDSFQEILAEVRLWEACNLLMDTDRSVLDISLACGFSNLSNFNRQFLRRRGRTPTAFRAIAKTWGDLAAP